jgi:Spy/CpxP family protein refolding chaperone
LIAGGYTEGKAALLAKQHGDIAAEIVKLRAAEMAQLYSLLTPEQQKKFSTMKFEHQERHSKGDKIKS